MKKNCLCLFFVLGSILSLAACIPEGPAGVNPQIVMDTMVAATVGALPSATFQPTSTVTLEPTEIRPSPTELPTETPPPTVTPLPTWTPIPTETIAPTATSAGGPEIGKRQGNANFACIVLSRTPQGIFEASFGQDIPVAWRIKNVGARDLEKENIDIGYISGQKMAIGGILFDLAETIPAGETGDVIITFEAPKTAGSYTTTWALFRGSNSFCQFSFSLVVK
jgi:hypothetical protein